ncbi:MAG: polysaccharide deacetylase family protein [Limisphaerales bacterium]
MKSPAYEWCCRLLRATQLHRGWRGPGPYLGVVLMFHRVASARQMGDHPFTRDLWVTPEKLENTIRFFRTNRYEIASLDRMNEALLTGRTEKPLAIFTFDDGFRDNFELAYPVFKKHQAPFAIYVASGLPDSLAVSWPYALEQLVEQVGELELELDAAQQRIPLGSVRSRTVGYSQLRETILSAGTVKFAHCMEQIFDRYGINLAEYSRGVSMSWDQIRQLALDPLVTLGSHTASHFMLSRLTAEEAAAEVEQGKRRLETESQRSARHFAYPYGVKPGWTDVGQTMRERFGFTTCVTTCPGYLCPEHAAHSESLPRFQVTQATSPGLLDIAFKRLIDGLRRRRKHVVVG